MSTQPPREARAFLGEMAHLLNAIFAALIQRESAYASVLGALLELAGEKLNRWQRSPTIRSIRLAGARGVRRLLGQGGDADNSQPIHIIRKPATQ